MTKITLSVCKVYKNSGSLRYHRDKTKKHWKHYFIDTKDGSFRTEWVSSIRAQILKRNKWKKRNFICQECGLVFQGFSKKDSNTCDCPQCEN